MRGNVKYAAVLLITATANTWAVSQEPIQFHPIQSRPVYAIDTFNQFPPPGRIHGTMVGEGYSPNPPVRSSTLGEWFRKCNACCWAHHNNFDCSTLKSEAVFIFGSCKSFYGERCLPRPQTVDHHGYYDRYGRY